MQSTITSRDNPKIKEYVRLRDSKSARAAEKKFILEGLRIVEDALRENAPLSAAFMTEDAAEKHGDTALRLQEKLADNFFVISGEVSKKLAETPSPQGVYVCAGILDKKLYLDKIESDGRFLILNRLQDPGNVGTILRTADAVGVSGVFLCGCCDIYNPKVVRSTMGSLFRLPIETKIPYEKLIPALKRRGIETCAAVVDKNAASLKEHVFFGGAAVVIGNEGSGLSESEALLCDKRLTIKMKGTIESLNAATAAALFLWELCS